MSSSGFEPVNAENPYLQTSTSVPEELPDFRYSVAENYQKTANAVNAREVALYQTYESVTGQQWPPLAALAGIPYAFTTSFRTMVVVPALALGANAIAHGIAGIGTTYVFTKMFGSIGNGMIWHAVPNDDIHLSIDATNVNVTIPAAYVGFTGRVIVEYLKDT